MDASKTVRSAAAGAALSLAATAAAIGLNHLYVLGPAAWLLAAGLAAAGGALLWWFVRTDSTLAFAGYMAVVSWVVAGFGVMKGLWNTTLRLFGAPLLSRVSSAFPKPTVGPLAFEMSGVAMFIGSLFVLHYALRVAEARGRFRPSATIAAALVAALTMTAAAYPIAVRDVWTAPTDGIVRIGVVVPTSGPYAVLGGSFVKAVQMAKDDLPRTKYRYELVVRDSGPDPAKARGVIEQLVMRERVDAIVGGVSLIGQVTKPFATAARIPHLCVCTVASIADGAYNFTNIPSPEAEGTLWTREAVRRGITRVAIVAQDYPSINNHVNAMKTEAARAGLSIVFERRFDEGATGFATVIAEAANANPDVYYVEALNPSLDALAGQLAAAGIRNVSSVVAPSLAERPGAFEGAWYTDSDLRDIAFKRRFEAKYPGTKFATHMMPYAYDSVNMIVQAFERGENPAVYVRNITSYEGSAGRVTKPRGSGRFQSAPAVWTIRNGTPVLLETNR